MRIISELSLGLSAFALAATLTMALPAMADSVDEGGRDVADAVDDSNMKPATGASEGDDATTEIAIDQPTDNAEGDVSGDEVTFDQPDVMDEPVETVADGDGRADCENCRGDEGEVTITDLSGGGMDEVPVEKDGLNPEIMQAAMGSGAPQIAPHNGIVERASGGSDRNIGESRGQCLNRVGEALTFLCKK